MLTEKNLDSLLETLEQLCREADLAASLSRRAREFVCEHHDWSRIGKVLERALLRTLERNVPSGKPGCEATAEPKPPSGVH
jgi:hypothetical protein